MGRSTTPMTPPMMLRWMAFGPKDPPVGVLIVRAYTEQGEYARDPPGSAATVSAAGWAQAIERSVWMSAGGGALDLMRAAGAWVATGQPVQAA